MVIPSSNSIWIALKHPVATSDKFDIFFAKFLIELLRKFQFRNKLKEYINNEMTWITIVTGWSRSGYFNRNNMEMAGLLWEKVDQEIKMLIEKVQEKLMHSYLVTFLYVVNVIKKR